MLYHLCFSPAYISILYGFYLLFRKSTQEDEFFHLAGKMKKETILERIKLLQQINGSDYRLYMLDIEKYYADGKITEREAERIEEVITNAYFDRFRGKWSAFKRADFSMKCMFILMFVYGFVYVNLVFSYGYDTLHQPEVSKTVAIISANCTLILPFLFGLVLLGFLGTFLSFLNLAFSNYGGINRASITFQEMVRSLKPGGRKTKIELGRANSSDSIFWP